MVTNSVTGLTATRMLAIEAASVVSGTVTNDHLILTKKNGQTIDAGNVRGIQGTQGVAGTIQTAAAGGDLTGNYPNPKIANGLKDADTIVPSMRTLGTGPLQAAAGDHSHRGLADTGWVNCTAKAGSAPFASATVVRLQYRKIGQTVHVRFSKNSTAAYDTSTSNTGNFANTTVFGVGSIPALACPSSQGVVCSSRFADTPVTVVINTDGSAVMVGGFARSWPTAVPISGDAVYMTDAVTP